LLAQASLWKWSPIDQAVASDRRMVDGAGVTLLKLEKTNT